MKNRSYYSSALVVTLALATVLQLSGCAYYNYFYNAQKNFEIAEKQRKAKSGNAAPRKTSSSGYTKTIGSAERMLDYYPGSRWEDNAILLIAKANYYDSKFRSTTGRVDELIARFPTSPLIEEANLYKGLSLLRLAQPDSARQILGDIFLNSKNRDFIALGHYGLGEYYLIDKRPEAALPEFRLAAQSADKDKWLQGESWVKAAETLTLLEKYTEAVELYDEILAEDISRRLRFEASLQRASALRNCGRAAESVEICKALLKDGAFLDDFPRVELEKARSLRATGENEEARETLEKLVESERRGEIGAEGQYELGSLRWEVDRSDTSALSALQAVKTTERSAKIVPFADSLASEIQALSIHYRRLQFFDREFSLLDSARLGLRELFPADTIWIDSSKINKGRSDRSKDKPTKRKPRDFQSRNRLAPEEDPNDPIQKMINEAIAKDPVGNANLIGSEPIVNDSTVVDSTLEQVVLPDTTVVPLDSIQRASIDSLFKSQQRLEWLSLAELHMLDRNDVDSASWYITTLLATEPDSELWARGIATSAYIARSRNDSAAYDSLYQLILRHPPDEEWKFRAEKALRVEYKQPPPTQTAALIDSAESIWRDQHDAETARILYLLAAEVADSGDTAAARGLLAAAFITRTALGQDSLANNLYSEVSTKFPSTAYGKIAQKRTPRGAGKGARPRPNADPEVEGMTGEPDVAKNDVEMAKDLIDEEPRVFEAAKVDEVPTLLTPPDIVEDYLRSYYPFEAFGDELSGNVELSLVIRSNGDIEDIQLIKADPEGYGFDEAAMQVIKTLTYRPGRNNGLPVNVRIKQTFTFKFPR